MEGRKMTEEKKEGLFKRLFGGKKENCCGIKIKEVKEDLETIPSSGCCASDTKKVLKESTQKS